MRKQAYALLVAVICHPVAALGAPPSTDVVWGEGDVALTKEHDICNLDIDPNPFSRYDPKGWREKYQINCWYPTYGDKSEYFIKLNDFDSTTGGVLFSKEGWHGRPPVDVWVQGLHKNDATVRYRRSLTLYRLTCWKGVGRYARLNFIAFDAKGSVVERFERPTAAMRVAVPGSKEEAFANAVCK